MSLSPLPAVCCATRRHPLQEAKSTAMGKKTEEENQALAAARAAASKQLSSASFQSTSFVSAVIVALLPCCTFLRFTPSSLWLSSAPLTCN